MKRRTILTPEQSAWLADTFARNRALYAGFRMEDDGAGDGDQGADGNDGDGSDDGDDKGFPANTPVKDMSPDQRAAYWEHQARRHESRNKDILKVTGGKYGDDLKAVFDELDGLRDAQRTDSEKAVEEARKAGRSEAAAEYGTRMARLAFEVALDHIEDAGERNELLDTLNLTSVLTDDGEVDTDKVRRIVTKIAPADKDQGSQRHDFGAGRRSNGGSKTGLSAGADLFAASRKKTTTGS